VSTSNNAVNGGSSRDRTSTLGPLKQEGDGLRPECTGCPVLPNTLFRDTANEQASRFGCVFNRAHACENQVLFSEASKADQLFALRSGLVKIVKSLENGKQRILRIVFPGTLFGLEALSAATHSAAAVALQDSEVCAVSRDEFLAFLRANSDSALNMIFFLAGEVAQLSGEITTMSFKDARTKVATLLRSLVSPDEISSASVLTLTLPFSSQEIGEILELSPETVSRTWSALRREGMIEKHGRKVVILDLEGLEKSAHR
jgi:CRP-like cAMP-binding protein